MGQKTNDAMVDWLTSFFIRRGDPPLATTVTGATISNPPTDGELDTAFGAIADLPDGFIGTVEGGASGYWGATKINSVWKRWQIT